MSAQHTQRARVHPDLVDRLLELYCDWRTECSAVQDTYDRFLRASASIRDAAFEDYSAALDREGSAAERYAAQIRLVASRAGQTSSPRPPRTQATR